MKKKLSLIILLLIAQLHTAQQNDPLAKRDTYGQTIWVDSILTSLTLDQKIGQLFMVSAYSNKDAKHLQELKDLIKNYELGGLVFFQGTADKQIEMTNELQSLSKVPLLIGFDGEWGLNMRLEKTYKFPWNMTLGAIRDNSLIEEFGRMVGKHSKRVGIHANFAPVVDVNINPKNPIIGNRSFGESRENVAKKAIAFTRGMQSEFVLASAKHFPGHGDTDADSHHTLPTIPFTERRLDSVELYPYKSLFKEGLTSVMVAHLSVPAFESNLSLPSSLSKNIVSSLLKDKMGFEGLIFTDALNMKGAADFSSSAEINLEVIKAGNDVLLLPSDVPGSFAKIKEAIEAGIITQERLDYSVKKILKAKYWAGLRKFTPISISNLDEELNGTDAEALHYKLVEHSTTLIKNDNDIFPIKDLVNTKIAYVKLGDDNHQGFLDRLNDYTNVDLIHGKTLDQLIARLKPYNLVIIGYHKSNANAWKDFKFTNKELVWLQEISRTNNVILDIFASAYSLLDIKTFTNIESVLVSYQNSAIAQEISAQQIFGALTTKGSLPVSINEDFSVGTGIFSNNLYRLSYGIPEQVDISSIKLKKVDSIAQVIIDSAMAPGLQILVARKGKVVYQKSFGYHTDYKLKKVQNSDLYDLASITKIAGALPLIMKAEEEGKFGLDTPLGEIMPILKGTNKDSITLKEALSHTGQLQAWIPYYLHTLDSISRKPLSKYYRKKNSNKFNIEVAENFYLRSDYKDTIFQMIADSPLREIKGYKYSGLIFYLFKDYLEKTYGQPMNLLAEQYFYKPLGANNLTYRPLDRFSKNRIVPTERDVYYRKQLLQGHVHDQGAAMLNGVNGNAGLFANANDLAKMMQMYLQDGFYGGKSYFKKETIEKFNTRYFEKDSVRRGLGFDKPQLDPEIKASCGCVSTKSFGHSGFTGTYTWADPESGLLFIFLSNRVYPNSENVKLVEKDMRTKTQQLVQDAIIR